MTHPYAFGLGYFVKSDFNIIGVAIDDTMISMITDIK